MRILAIDFGTKRIGLAVSDALGITAQGLPTLKRENTRTDLERLRAVAREYSVEQIIVGHPISAQGAETEMSRRAALFADKLRRKLECEVKLWDERLTTAEAIRMLRGAGLSIEKRKRARDRVAAVLLLQNYLAAAAHQAQIDQNGEGR